MFTVPPSVDELRRRLHKRGTETDEVIEKRIAQFQKELPCVPEYDYVVLNDALEDAVADFVSVIRLELMRPEHVDLSHLEEQK